MAAFLARSHGPRGNACVERGENSARQDEQMCVPSRERRNEQEASRVLRELRHKAWRIGPLPKRKAGYPELHDEGGLGPSTRRTSRPTDQTRIPPPIASNSSRAVPKPTSQATTPPATTRIARACSALPGPWAHRKSEAGLKGSLCGSDVICVSGMNILCGMCRS
jgi:hypothetical protein